MNKSISHFGVSLAAISTLLSCINELSAHDEAFGSAIPFEVCASSDDTKTSMNGRATCWDSDDCINLFHACAGIASYIDDGQFIITADNLGDNRFTGTLGSALEAGKYDWYAFYPYSSANKTPAGSSNNDFGNTTIGGISQNQVGNNSTAHLCGTTCPLCGIASGVAHNATPTIVMKHLVSIVEVIVANNSGSDLTVTSVSFTGTEDIAGEYFVNFAKSPVVYTKRGVDYVSDKATLLVTGGEAIPDKGSAKFYIAIKPFTVSDGILRIAVNGYEKEIPVTKQTVFAAGKIKKVNFNFDDANAVDNPRQAPLMSSTHPYTNGNFEMMETEPGVYTIEHVWLSGQEKDIYFPAGTSGFYYNAVNGWIASEDPEFDVVYSNERVPLKVQQWGGKNYTEKYYTIILDTNTMKLKVLQDRGERFWITGDNLSWDLNKYEMDVDKQAGKATWRGYLKAGKFKIHGENLYDKDPWHGPANTDYGSGEWYFHDSSRENGISMNSDADHKWNVQAGYYALEFNYKANPMTFVVTPVQSLDLKVNGKPLNYDGNYEYSIETQFTKGEALVLSGCKNLEYVRMDPDFLRNGNFNAKTGTYRFILHLQSHDSSWANGGTNDPTCSWTMFKGIDNGGTYSTLILSGNGVGDITLNNRVGWTVTSPDQPFMAEVEDNVFQFTGRYKGFSEWSEPYDRWTLDLNFKYFGTTNWGYGTPNGVILLDNTGKIKQISDDPYNNGNFTWLNDSEGNRWEDYGYYRITLKRNNDSHIVIFDRLNDLNGDSGNIQTGQYIKTAGKVLYKPDGTVFTIKGVNLNHWLTPEAYCFGFSNMSVTEVDKAFRQIFGDEYMNGWWKRFLENYISDGDFKYLGSIGANTVRLPLTYKLFNDTFYLCDNNPNAGFAFIDYVVKMCKEAGLYLILDMHVAPGGQSGASHIDDSDGYPRLFESQANMDEYCRIWRMIAERYAEEPIILGYELLNEPIDQKYSALYPYLQTTYQRVTAAIREVDKNHIIILDGGNFCNDFSMLNDYSFDSKIVLTGHRYNSTYVADFAQVSNSSNLPMFIGEFGHWNGGQEQNSDIVSNIISYGMGYTYWPFKKMDNWESLLGFDSPGDWMGIQNFVNAQRDNQTQIQNALQKVDVAKARTAMERYLENCKYTNCFERSNVRNGLQFGQ